ncbi:MAG: ATP synthase F0 subunit B [Vampirovibrionales bacterium]|nr:ATP synthase F0 subunit B [Vampirovibrionales bacterium]
MIPLSALILNAAATAHGELGEQSLWETVLHSNLINFIIAVLLIALLVKKLNVGGMLAGNREKLKSEIESLAAERQKAEAQLAELKRETANLHQEVSTILGQAQATAEKMAAQILEDARRDASALIENSKRRIEVEHHAAAKDIEKRLLADALQDARLELAQNLNSHDQKRSVDDFISELSHSK